MLDPIRELEKLTQKRTNELTNSLLEYIIFQTLGYREGMVRAWKNYVDLLRKSSGYSAMLGLKRADLELQNIKKKGNSLFFSVTKGGKNLLSSNNFKVSHDFAYDDALDVLEDSVKVVKRNAFGEEIRSVFSFQNYLQNVRPDVLPQNVMTGPVLLNIKDALFQDVLFGEDPETTKDRILKANDIPIKKVKNYTKGRVENIFRTELAKVYDAARERAIEDPEIKTRVPAWIIDTVEDSARRPDHAKLHGWIISVDSQLWNYLKFPIFYQCRCVRHYIGVDELKRRGHWKNGQLIETNWSFNDLPKERFPARSEPGIARYYG